MYGDVALPEKEQFRYLGMLVDKHMSLKVSEEHAVRLYMAAQQRIKEFVHEHDQRIRPHALIWLSKACMAFRLGYKHAKCGIQGLQGLQGKKGLSQDV
eukprot:293441-Pelagomonas_calceolata.AAC.1